MRFGLEKFDALDKQAAAEGWPPGWRMDHDAREENRQTVLGGRFGKDLRVFAYGSLIWDPGVAVAEYRHGALQGWQRRFCMRLDGGRGTYDRPGLMLALDEGGRCDGMVFRISGALVEQETQFLWRREMFAGTYVPCFFDVSTPQGPVEALVFVMDRSNDRYVGTLSDAQTADVIRSASGWVGTNFDYLDSVVRHLSELGLQDKHMADLHALATS